MNLSRVLIAALVGAVAMFLWEFVDHRVLPLGEIGVQSLPDEAAITSLLKTKIHVSGFYYFPGEDQNDKSEQARKEMNERAKRGPTGIVIFDPGGTDSFVSQLLVEFGSDFAAALLLAVVFSRMQMTKWLGALLGLAMGLFGWMCIDVSYWNWYRFPAVLIMATMIEQGVAGLVTGLAVAAVLGTRRPVPAIAKG